MAGSIGINLMAPWLRRDPRRYVRYVKGLLRVVIMANRETLRSDPGIPRLYDSGVVYQREKREHFDDLTTCMFRGWGDCEDLSAWLIAERIERDGRPCQPFIYWRDKPSGKRIYHVQVQYPDGTIEDPSRVLGM